MVVSPDCAASVGCPKISHHSAPFVYWKGKAADVQSTKEIVAVAVGAMPRNGITQPEEDQVAGARTSC